MSRAAFTADQNNSDDNDALPPPAPSQSDEIPTPFYELDELPETDEPIKAPDAQWTFDDLIIAKHSSMHPDLLNLRKLNQSIQPNYPELSEDEDDLFDDEGDDGSGSLDQQRTLEGLGNRDIRLIHSEDTNQEEGEPSLLDVTVSQFDDQAKKEFKKRVKIGNLRKPGQTEGDEDDAPQTAAEAAAESPLIAEEDLDTHSDEAFKLTMNRGQIPQLRSLLRRKSGNEDEFDLEQEKKEGESSDDDDDYDELGTFGFIENDGSDSDVEVPAAAGPILYGHIDRLEDQRRSEELEAQQNARRLLGQRPDEIIFTVDKQAAEDHFKAKAAAVLDQKKTLEELQYVKIYPKEPRKWVEDLKTPPGWFCEETGHWEGVEHGDDFEYSEYWRAALPMIAAEREAAVKKETPKGMKIVAPADTEGFYRFGITQEEVNSIPDLSQKVLDAISFNDATQREINQFRKERAIDKWSYKPHDTGSTPVQIAVLSEKINYLSDHLTRHPKDKHSAYGFQRIRNRRKALMKYLKKKDTPTYFKLLRELNIRDV